jgi:hypothetical protein
MPKSAAIRPIDFSRFSANATLADVVRLYMNPPNNAIVLCVDEKPQIQALERNAPLLPLLREVVVLCAKNPQKTGFRAIFYSAKCRIAPPPPPLFYKGRRTFGTMPRLNSYKNIRTLV